MRSLCIGIIVGCAFGFWIGLAAFLFCTKIGGIHDHLHND
jgi:hypothetical protein